MKFCIITALFDIQRHKHESNPNALKTIDDYYKSFKITLQLNCPMIIYTEEKTKQFILDNRPKHYETKIIIQKLEEIPYYHYRDKMLEIINLDNYKSKIKNPNRIECNLPEYCIIQYSKFEWLRDAIEKDHLMSDYYFWMDAGCSRFFLDVDISSPFPGPKTVDLLKKLNDNNNGVFLIQGRHGLTHISTYFNTINIENLIWDSVNMLVGTLFGGSSERLLVIADEIRKIFEQDMLDINCVNNEQIALGMLFLRKKKLFNVFESTNQSVHLPIFKLMSE